MLEQVWLGVLRRIPVAFHEGLVMATVTGADLVLQSIIRLEDDCLIFKGRPSGTNEAGKLMVVPFNQLNYIFFPGRLSEQQMHAIFGEGDKTFATLPENLTAAPETLEPEPPAPPEAASTAPAPETAAEPALRSPQQSKSILLARLRAKLGGDGPRPVKR